jgi:hypothetical protein
MTDVPPPKYGTVFPRYCPRDLREGEPCPRCGADDREVRHVCLARNRRPEPEPPLFEVVYIDRKTGEVI